MFDASEPREVFVEGLERQIVAEVRRRARLDRPPLFSGPPRLRAIVAAGALALISMAAGGTVVALAYEAEQNEQRSVLSANFEQRVALARERVKRAEQMLLETQRLVSVGSADPADLERERAKVAEATLRLKTTQLQLEEVRASGREPVDEITAPAVSGRDFVGERMRAEVDFLAGTVERERAAVADLQKRLSLGVAKPIEIEVARVRETEADVALAVLREKLAIRRLFMSGLANGPVAELSVLENEAASRRRALEARLQLAKKQAADLAARVSVGTAAPIEHAEVLVRVTELEAEISKADLDLLLIRKRLDEAKRGK
jgi:outer membrane protein TolC